MTTHRPLKHIVALGAIAIAASSVFAADAPAGTRAEVIAQTLAARADGTLIPAGEGIEVRAAATSSRSTLTRAGVVADVLAARASGSLVAAGEAGESAISNIATGPALSRAAVKAQVLAARASGDLIPAGEGLVPEAQQRSRPAAAWMAQAHPRSPALDAARTAQANTASTPQ